MSSLGFLTTNVAGGPYIALTGGGTFWAGADAIGVATVPYVPNESVFTIKTTNLSTASINRILDLSAGDT